MLVTGDASVVGVGRGGGVLAVLGVFLEGAGACGDLSPALVSEHTTEVASAARA